MQLAPIVVNDGATTPVSRTFTPVAQDLSTNGSKVKFLDRSANGGIAIGFPELHLVSKDVVGEGDLTRYVVRATWPVLETISNNTASGYAPAPKRAYHVLYEGSWTVPKRSTTVDRQTFAGLVANLYDTAIVKDMLINFNPMA